MDRCNACFASRVLGFLLTPQLVFFGLCLPVAAVAQDADDVAEILSEPGSEVAGEWQDKVILRVEADEDTNFCRFYRENQNEVDEDNRLIAIPYSTYPTLTYAFPARAVLGATDGRRYCQLGVILSRARHNDNYLATLNGGYTNASDITDRTRIIVNKRPPAILSSFDNLPKKVTMRYGVVRTISAYVDGTSSETSPMSYQWYRNGVEISGASGDNTTDTGKSRYSLLLACNDNNIGTNYYTLVVWNEFGQWPVSSGGDPLTTPVTRVICKPPA